MTPSDIGAELTRYAPYLLVLLWVVLITVLRGARQRRGQAPPAPAPPVRTPQPVGRRAPPAVPPPIAAAYAAVAAEPRPSAAEAARAEAAARVEAVALAAQVEAATERRNEIRLGASWQQAMVIAEIMGSPIALRRSGTLGPPGTF